MARKNLLASVTATLKAEAQENTETSNAEARASYTRRGASRSMIQSLDDLAETSLRMLDGETVVLLDPADLDGSFVADRIGEDDDEYIALLEAIRQSGQSTPILVRPHPDDDGRYMIVFGHRRARVARTLGIKVRAVIKPIADIEHVIAQGQENTARADLSFIEKALFARRLLQSAMSKDVVKSALTIDDTLLSRMLSVAEIVPDPVLDALGAAKGVGRDRWEELKKTVLNPNIAARAVELTATEAFLSAEDKFAFLQSALKSGNRPVRRAAPTPAAKSWSSVDKAITFTVNENPKKVAIELTSSQAKPFGAWLTERLDTLFEEFTQAGKQEHGD
jgi:ParB family chromosome partitioning protein